MAAPALLEKSTKIVVKVGSSLVTNNGQGINHAYIKQWAAQIAALRRLGKQVVLVSSGAIAQGMASLGWQVRPKLISELQAAAAVGQMGLAQTYEEAFKTHGLQTAQLLLTHADLSQRGRYINARDVIQKLLSLGVVPIVNENDSIVTKEIKFGDNDTLGALVCNAIDADLLIILTDQNGLYDSDPRSNPDARFIDHARTDDTQLQRMAGGAGSRVGTGGMLTKVLAAKRAASSGASTIIASGHEPDVLVRLAGGEALGTLLEADDGRLSARKQWIADHLHTAGSLVLDEGAIRAITIGRRSLLPIGILKVEGFFKSGDVVSCVDEDGREHARGIISCSSPEAQLFCGKSTQQIRDHTAEQIGPAIIHRNDMVIVPAHSQARSRL